MAAAWWVRWAAMLVTGVTTVYASTDRWEQLRVRHQSTSVGAGISGFWSVPATYAGALLSGWTPVDSAPGLAVLAVGSAAEDLGFTPLYRANLAGRLVGFSVAVPVVDVYRSGPHEALPAAPGGSNELVWLRGAYYMQSTVLFVPPAQLQAGGAGRDSRIADAVGLWVRNTSDASGYTELPTDLAQLVASTRYTRQGCAPGLGTVYYHNMSESAEPVEECGEWNPWSVLGDLGAAVGLGWQTFGAPLVYGRDWYDDIPSAHVPSHAAALAAAAPGACARYRAWAERYGLISLHVYFTPEPWSLGC